MPGTFIVDYQGFTCTTATFRRSRGLSPDSSVVELFVPDWSAIEIREGVAPRQTIFSGGRLDQPGALYESGDLFLRQVVDGDVQSRFIEGMFVSDVRKPNADEPAGEIQLTLVDGRILWNRGFMREWRWVSTPLVEILEAALAVLPWHSGLNRVPQEWRTKRVTIEFNEVPRPRDVIARLLDDYNAELTIGDDKSVSIWNQGEFDDPALDPTFIEFDGGNGNVVGRRMNYPPQTVGIVGGPRIASVGIDNWIPVIKINGQPVPLGDAIREFVLEDLNKRLDDTQQTIESLLEVIGERLPPADQISEAAQARFDRLTELETEVDAFREALERATDEDERTGLREKIATRLQEVSRIAQAFATDRDVLEQLDGLAKDLKDAQKEEISRENFEFVRKFVLRPDAWQTYPGFSAEALDAIRKDAFRLWQLPGAETYNKHLLPILKRAERDSAGHRKPIKAKIWTFQKKSDTAVIDRQATEDEFALREVRLALSRQYDRGNIETGEFKDKIQAILEVINFDDRDEDLEGFLLTGDDKALFMQIMYSQIPDLKLYDAAISAGDTALAAELERRIEAYNRTQLAKNPFFTGGLERELFLAAIEAGKRVRAQDPGGLNELKNKIREIRNARREAARAAGNLETPAEPKESYFFVNYGARIHDTTARLEDAELGLVRTNLVGLLVDSNQNVLADCKGLQAGPGPHGSWPVVVYFGTRVAPRRTQAPTGGSGADVVPPQVREAELRVGDRSLGNYSIAVDRDLRAKPLNEATPEATKIVYAPKLVELIELTGVTNKNELDRTALAIAEPHLAEVPFGSSGSKKYLGVHKVDCNGLVSGVEISTRPNLMGLSTTVITGRTSAPFLGPNKTRVNRPGKQRPVVPLAEDPLGPSGSGL